MKSIKVGRYIETKLGDKGVVLSIETGTAIGTTVTYKSDTGKECYCNIQCIKKCRALT